MGKGYSIDIRERVARDVIEVRLCVLLRSGLRFRLPRLCVGRDCHAHQEVWLLVGKVDGQVAVNWPHSWFF
jgi:hypothetical protein